MSPSAAALTEAFYGVLNLSAAASVLGCAVLGVRALLRKRLPRWIFYALWLLVLARMVIPGMLPSPLSVYSLFARRHADGKLVMVPPPEASVPFPGLRPAPRWAGEAGGASPVLGGAAVAPREVPLGYILAVVWACGFALLALYAAGCYFYTLRRLRGAEHVDARVTGMPESVPVYRSGLFRTPVVCGLAFPRVVLPLGLDLSASPALRHVMSHELTHVLRRDNVWKAVATLALYLHWFNPLLWLCYSRYVTDMEASCDEKVVRSARGDIRSEYAAALLGLASAPRAAFAGGFLSFGECSLKERIRQIMQVRFLRTPRARASAAVVGAAVVLGLAVVFLTDPLPQPSISVSSPAGESPAPSQSQSASGALSSQTDALPLHEWARRQPDASAPAQPESSAASQPAAIAPTQPPSSAPAQPESSAPPDADPSAVLEPDSPASSQPDGERWDDVDYVNLYPPDPLYSYRMVEDAQDRARLLAAVDAALGTAEDGVEPQGEILMQLEVRYRDGSKEEFDFYSNALASGGSVVATDPAALDALFGVADELANDYPPRIQWFGFMNSYRITAVMLESPEAAAVFDSAASAAQRDAILDIAGRLRRLGAVCTEAVRHGEQPFLEGGALAYTLRLTFDSGDVYEVALYDNARLVAAATGMYYDVAYALTGADDAASLSAALDGYLGLTDEARQD